MYYILYIKIIICGS